MPTREQAAEKWNRFAGLAELGPNIVRVLEAATTEEYFERDEAENLLYRLEAIGIKEG